MIRHVTLHGGRTFCHLDAWGRVVATSALQLNAQHRSALTLVLEASFNDKYQQSEILKQDFAAMIDCLLDTGKQLIISGPLLPPRYGDVTTRVLSHLWTIFFSFLKQTACTQTRGDQGFYQSTLT